jgi:tetratricopeptide (TPR) repeat protein
MDMLLIGLLAFWIQGGVFASHAVGDRLFEQRKFKQALCCYHWYYSICRFVPHSRGGAALRLCACYFYMAQYPQARRYAEEALQVTATQEQAHHVIYAQAYLAILLAVERQYEEAEELSGRYWKRRAWIVSCKRMCNTTPLSSI